jgi:hypothetical protein
MPAFSRLAYEPLGSGMCRKTNATEPGLASRSLDADSTFSFS